MFLFSAGRCVAGHTGSARVVVLLLVLGAGFLGSGIYLGFFRRPAVVTADQAAEFIQQSLAKNSAFGQHMADYAAGMDPVAQFVRPVRDLRPLVAKISELRNQPIKVGTYELPAWEQICRTSSSAAAMDEGFSMLQRAVEQADQLIDLPGRFGDSVAGFNRDLELMRQEPTPQSCRNVCASAGQLKACLASMDSRLSELGASLQIVQDALANGRSTLDGLSVPVVADIARAIANLLDKPLAASKAALAQIGQYRGNLAQDMGVLGAIAAYPDGKEITLGTSN